LTNNEKTLKPHELTAYQKGLIARLIEDPGFVLLQKLSGELISREQEFLSSNILETDRSVAQSNRAIGRIEGIRELLGYPDSLIKG
tara:strand:+ start:1563 stop:1820 length:258 start_codon:yes stop_codon:yes gene_type:complete